MGPTGPWCVGWSCPGWRVPAGHFGDVVIIDLFYIFSMQLMLIIDEATRWKICSLCMRKDAASLGKCFLHTWLRYCGPPRVARSDQEGGIKSEEFGKLCDRFSIYRQLAGSDSKGEHTTTGDNWLSRVTYPTCQSRSINM